MPSEANTAADPSAAFVPPTPAAEAADASRPAATADLPASLHMAVHGSLESAEARWREAWPRLSGTAFQNFDWVQAWFETLGRREGWKVCIAELRADSPEGPTVLLLPLGFRRVGLLRVMGFLGGEMADYQAPLIDPGFARALTSAHAARLWRGFTAILPSVDLIRMRRMPAFVGTTANPFATVPGACHTEDAHAARLPDSFEAYAAGRSTSLMAHTRRMHRRLAKAGDLVVRLRVTDPAEVRLVMAALARQKSRRWIESGARDAFALPEFQAFFERLTTRPMQGVESVVAALMLDGEPVATHWGMRMGGILYWLMPAYDEKWSHCSPGRVLMEATVRGCIEDGLSLFDMTAGDESYKLQWGDEHLKLYSLQESGSSLGNLAVRIGQARALAKRVPVLRRAVRRLLGRK